ncbi:aminoglycoside resistance protein [Nocardioides sp. Root190]|uniref:aminoglycoside phosphotransferase family protein n=1 Tax=Nocardioides sp. Root190 TaxID=1736488 RepID=UPI0006FEC5C9|nr:aminoglycoside phosphotransferase family protein [Nocardioides sp. Root190]KRB77345.1 aminoglycoside resistance protein [Nocardioides sp. Root190]
MPPVVVPAALDEQRRLGADWAAWLDRLPGLAHGVLDDWALTPEGGSWHGFCSLVLPVTTATGAPAALKIGLPDQESEHEHLALQHWHGRGAARLLRADPGRRALLLERLDRTDLAEVWDVEACEVVAGLYADLHVAPLPQLRQQASYVEQWTAALRRDAREVPVPRRMVEQALALAEDLGAEPATAVIHADLHDGNVLRGRRDGEDVWLAIDPKPTNGDPHYELEPMLRNRFEEYAAPGAVGSVRDGIRRRFHTLVDVAGFDESRARDWVVVRSVLNAHWAHEDAVRAGRALDTAERDHVTACISVAKAVQD